MKMKRIILTMACILWASTAGAMSPSFGAAVTAGGGVIPEPFLVDDYANAEGVNLLSAHTPTTGGAWVQDASNSAATLYANGNIDAVLAAASSAAIYYNDATSPSEDYTIWAEGSPRTSYFGQSVFGACGRLNGSGGGYCATMGDTGILKIIEKSSSTTWDTTTIATAGAISININTVYRVQLSVVGNSLTATVYPSGGGTPLVTLTVDDSTFDSAGYAGIIINTGDPYIYRVEAY